MSETRDISRVFKPEYMMQRIEDLTICNQRLEEALKNAEQVLLKLEQIDDGNGQRICAWCGTHVSVEHTSTCRLAESLREIKGIWKLREFMNRLKEIEKRVDGDLKPLWGKLQTVDDVRYLLDLVKMQQAEIERLKGRKSSGQDPLEVHR